MPVVEITEKNFDVEVVKASKPVLVDFWAEWCGPCRMIAPIVEEISDDLSDQLKVGKVNVDEAQALAQKFNIMSIPTLILFKAGKPVEMIVGAMSKDQMLEKIEPKL